MVYQRVWRVSRNWLHRRSEFFRARARNEVSPIKYLVIHHTAGNETAQEVSDYHRTKNYPKSNLESYSAYHFIIGKDGTVVMRE